MAQQADGTVYINSSIDTDGFTAGGKEIEAAARRAAKTVQGIGDAARIALEKQTAAFVKSNQLYAQQEQKVQDLQNKLEEMAGQMVETTAFKEIQKQIDTDTAKLNRLIQTQEEFFATGGKESSTAYQRRQMQIEELRNSIEYAKAEQDELLQSGQAYQPVDTSAVTDKLIAEQQRLQQMGEALNVSYDSLKSKVEQYGGSIAGAAQKNGLLQKALSSVAAAAKRAGAAMLLFHKNTKTANKTVGSGLKTILKYTLGIRSLYVLFNKVRNAIKEGFKNLAQYSDETNRSLSALKSSSTQLKNSLATAFAPILTVIEPILTRFINLLSQVITYVGMFFAALTGKSSFTKAVAVQEDYAASLGDTADNAKEANKYLSGLDEIRTYSEDKNASGSGAGGVSPADMFETVPIESKIKEFADKVKQILLEMFAPLREAWNKYGDSIMETLGKIKDSFAAFGVRIVNPTVDWFKNLNWEPLLASVDNLLKKLQPLIDVILDGLAWAYENVLLPFGKWAIEEGIPAVLDAISGALDLISAMAEKAAPWLQAIWDNFLAPVADFVGDAFVAFFETVGQVLSDIANNETAVTILTGIAAAIGLIVAAITAWNVVQAILNALLTANPLGLIVMAIAAVIAAIILCITYWDEIKAATSDTWNEIKSTVSDIWGGIVSTIKNSVNSVIGFINGMISGIITGINTMINALNSLHIDVPDWIPAIGGKSIGFSIPTITAPQIPYLATGAVIPPNAPFLAVMGDQKNGKNLELPEKLLRQILDEKLGNSQGSRQIVLTVQLDRKVLYREIIEEAKLRQTITGRNGFSLA